MTKADVAYVRDGERRVSHPGYSAAWGPTTDWHPKPKHPWTWVHYSPPDADGMSTRFVGFVDSESEAERMARGDWKWPTSRS